MLSKTGKRLEVEEKPEKPKLSPLARARKADIRDLLSAEADKLEGRLKSKKDLLRSTRLLFDADLKKLRKMAREGTLSGALATEDGKKAVEAVKAKMEE